LPPTWHSSEEDAPQRIHDLREVLKTGSEVDREDRICLALHAPRPAYTGEAIYQQTQRWIKAGVFEEMVHDLRVLLRLASGRAPNPTAAILDSRTLRSSPESGHRSGYDTVGT